MVESSAFLTCYYLILSMQLILSFKEQLLKHYCKLRSIVVTVLNTILKRARLKLYELFYYSIIMIQEFIFIPPFGANLMLTLYDAHRVPSRDRGIALFPISLM